MRKIKYFHETVKEKIEKILEDFPRIEDIHPFYADLINILYDKDSYKLALGQLNTCRNLIGAISRDYIRMMKYADSAFRCKTLKRAALGRMATLVKRQSGLEYLEQVRQHMARLPSIDPSMRTLLLTGFPNVGKSSFMNNVTRANSEVQPYAFTTQSLHVGHTDYKLITWQVIDSPGILDKPLDDRNAIEMLSVTAMAHLQACILFLIDVSEHCGYSIENQIALFKSIKPLFVNKPLIVVLTKIDLVRYEQLTPENRKLLEDLSKENVKMIGMSNITKEGIEAVKQEACETLITYRVEQKLSKNNKSVENILSRVNVTFPKHITQARQTFIPDSVLMELQNPDLAEERKQSKELEFHRELEFGPTYAPDVKKHYLLKDESWKYDAIPEIMDGKNILDFVDPDILKKVDALIKEEEERLLNIEEVDWASDEYFISEKQEALYNAIEAKNILARKKKNDRVNTRAFVPKKYRPKSFEQLTKELKQRGMDDETLERAHEHARSQSRNRSRSALSVPDIRERSVSEARQILDAQERGMSVLGKRKRSVSEMKNRVRSQSKTDRLAGLPTPSAQLNALERARKKIKLMGTEAKRGVTDTHIDNMRPKYLLSGKRRVNGKADRR